MLLGTGLATPQTSHPAEYLGISQPPTALGSYVGVVSSNGESNGHFALIHIRCTPLLHFYFAFENNK